MVVTLLAGGLLGLLYFVLSWRVVQVRQSARVSVGDGGDAQLLMRIRAHANFAEYVPICLILILAIELSTSAPPPMLWVAAGALVLARLFHAIGMAREGANPFRLLGALFTWVVMVGLSGWAVVIASGY